MSTELETDVYLYEMEVGGRELSVYYTIKTVILEEKEGNIVECPRCRKVFREDYADEHEVCVKEVLAGYEELDISSKKFVKIEKKAIDKLKKEIDEMYHLCELCEIKRGQSVCI